MNVYKKQLILLLCAATLLRLVVAASIELGNDEVYYWTYSQHLQLNYFDHPPMVSLMIRLFTGNLRFQYQELFIRLGSIVCSGTATWFMFMLATRLFDEKTGLIAALLYTASLYSSVIAGIFCMPDSPQMLFWMASLFVLSRLFPASTKAPLWWMLFGICTGLCIMSKIHGVFIWSGLILYLLFYDRKRLASPWPYLSLVICLIMVSPIFFWNVQNHFITYHFHAQRVETHRLQFQADSFLRELFGEIFYNNPINYLATVATLVAYFRFKPVLPGHAFLKITLLVALPMIALLVTLSMFNDTLPHWSGPAYVTLLPLVALYLSRRNAHRQCLPFQSKLAAMALFGILLVSVAGVLAFPGTLSNKKTGNRQGEGDFTLDMYGWHVAAEQTRRLILQEKNCAFKDRIDYFIANKWFPAAHIDYYIARPLGMQVIGLGNPMDLHQYVWLNTYALAKGSRLSNAYCLIPSNYLVDVHRLYGADFQSIDSLSSFTISRGGQACRYFTLYRLKNFCGHIPVTSH